jgi:hypothetical protein
MMDKVNFSPLGKVKIIWSICLMVVGGMLVGLGLTAASGVRATYVLIGLTIVGVGGYLFGSNFQEQPKVLTEPNSTSGTESKLYAVAYWLCLLLGFWQVFSQGVSEGMSTIGIALIFDPFDASRAWGEKKLWQRMWLIAHLALTFTLLGFALSGEASWLDAVLAKFSQAKG